MDHNKIYNNVSFLCIPSLYEGFPNVVMEALNRNIPVLGDKRCSGVNKLVINNINGFLYDDLEKSLRHIMENSETMKSLRQNCQKTIENYNMNAVHELWYENIVDVINE